MASTTLKTYGGKSQKPKQDIFENFFQPKDKERPTKNSKRLIARLELGLPEKDGSYLASDSLHVSMEDTFDKLRKGPLLNSVNFVNSFKKLESSESDFTMSDLFPRIQKKPVNKRLNIYGRISRKRKKVGEDEKVIEKSPEQLNIKKRKFESKFKKPSIVVEDTSDLNSEIGKENSPQFCSTPVNYKNKNILQQNISPICAQSFENIKSWQENAQSQIINVSEDFEKSVEVFQKNDTKYTNNKASKSRFSTPENVTKRSSKRSNNSAIKQLNYSDPGIVSKNNTDLTTNLRKSLSDPLSCISIKEDFKESIEELCKSNISNLLITYDNKISKSLSESHENITKRSSNREIKMKQLYVLLDNPPIGNHLDNEHGPDKNSVLSINNTHLIAESFQSFNDRNDFKTPLQKLQTDKNLYVLLKNVTINKECDQGMNSNSILSIDNTDLTAESVHDIQKWHANASIFSTSNDKENNFEKSIQELRIPDKNLYVLLKNITINKYLDKECDQGMNSNSILSINNEDLTAESVHDIQKWHENASIFSTSNDKENDFEKSIQELRIPDKNLYVLLKNITIKKYLDKECDQGMNSNSILSIDNKDLTAESVHDIQKWHENASIFSTSNDKENDFEKSIQELRIPDKNLYVLLENMTIHKYLDKEHVNKSVKNCDQTMSIHSIDNTDLIETESSSGIEDDFEEHCQTDESVKSYKDNSVYQSTNQISRSLSSSHENITKRSTNSTNTSAIKSKELYVLFEKKSIKHEQSIVNVTGNQSVLDIQEKTNDKSMKQDSVNSVILEGDEFLMPLPIITKKSVKFKPGKSWRRSLSLHQNSIVVDETTQCTCGTESSCSCGKCQISRLSRAQIKRCSIRVVPIPTKKSSRRTTILEDYAKTSYVPDQDIVDSHLENSVRSLSISSRNTRYKKSVSVVTAREVVLRRCGQTEPLPFDECYPSSALKNCQKIGEGVYGEVFLYKNQNGQTSVMKVIPIEGDLIINGERQKKFQEILSEVIIAMELSNLRNSKKNSTCGFSEVQKIRCVQGCYPERLLDLWNLYEETKGTENDSPEVFNEDQLYIVLELANGGKDLEGYQFTNAQQAFSMFQQVACSLAIAENELRFEHRDLHWGNILLSTVDRRDKQTFCLDGRVIEVPTLGVSVAIIDFTLSRIEYDGVVIFNDLSVDPDLFTGEGDYQFEIYRQMQTKNSNKWHLFEPYTNLLWLHYTLDKAITALHYKNTKSKLHKEYLTKMQSIKDYILNYNSVKEFVLDYFN